jgi:hypothetical protein
MKTKTKTPAARDGKWFLREIKRRAADEMAVILARVQAGTATEKDKNKLRLLAAKI